VIPTVGPFRIHSRVPAILLAGELLGLQRIGEQFERTLGITVSESGRMVDIHIFEEKRAYESYLRRHHPQVAVRRALFVADESGGARILAYRGSRLGEDLRHEGTHALIFLTVGSVPLWLDEGLAEWFETDEGDGEARAARVGRLVEEDWRRSPPSLARLEARTEMTELEARDYREAWAWVDYLLSDRDHTKGLLLGYLAEGPKLGGGGSLSEALHAAGLDDLESRLVAHIRSLAGREPARLPEGEAETTRGRPRRLVGEVGPGSVGVESNRADEL
jgi:hypothetical protein